MRGISTIGFIVNGEYFLAIQEDLKQVQTVTNKFKCTQSKTLAYALGHKGTHHFSRYPSFTCLPVYKFFFNCTTKLFQIASIYQPSVKSLLQLPLNIS